jgi:tetratricopeptide (TPR) repeat protein
MQRAQQFSRIWNTNMDGVLHRMSCPLSFSSKISPSSFQANTDEFAGKETESHNSDSIGSKNNEFKISPFTILQILQGIVVAAKSTEDIVSPVIQCIRLQTSACTPYVWLDTLCAQLPNLKEEPRLLGRLSIGIAFLLENGRAEHVATPSELSLVWSLVRDALTSPLLNLPLFAASRSAQGFLAVPLCSLIKDGNIELLFRFHVWLPGEYRGNPDFELHSHQSSSQSWVLAGEGRDLSYDVKTAADAEDATHAKYALSWTAEEKDGTANDNKNVENVGDNTYKTRQQKSTVINTGKLVKAALKSSEVHTRNTTYSIPAAAYHRSEVSPDILHATLFVFDSRRGFVKEADVIGPKDGKSYTQHRDPAGMTAAELVHKVELIRSWEIYLEQGGHHAKRAEWEDALRVLNSALSLCDSDADFPNSSRYKSLVLGELGSTNRRFGRYDQARDMLEKAVNELGPCKERADFSGELCVVYRHLGQLEQAKHAAEIEYNTVKEIQLEHSICRTVGNLGMINYQLSQRNGDESLLDLAIKQLTERIERARHLKNTSDTISSDPKVGAQIRITATTWEAIGLARLSLCYTAKGKNNMAVDAARLSLDATSASEDTTVVAMSRFFYGRALLRSGQLQEALKQFNQFSINTCTPVIAMCKEPSMENRQYLRELVDAGASMDLIDEQGYAALDYVVFNEDKETEQIVLNGLHKQYHGAAQKKVEDQYLDSKRRKGYRELFQEKMRPELLVHANDSLLMRLRRVYADELHADEKKKELFDGLTFIAYSDFQQFGRLPRSDDGLAQGFMSSSDEGSQSHKTRFVIFFSYRWINKHPGSTSPDDEKHTQFRRMVKAVEDFLQLHPSVDREELGIWVVSNKRPAEPLCISILLIALKDHACVDQSSPLPGVSALPLIVAQCDALISLVDDTYYERAWCSVEVMMMQILVKSYNIHLWYEHVLVTTNEGVEMSYLRKGPMDMEITMAEKVLTFEADRPKILFLERQSRLLG